MYKQKEVLSYEGRSDRNVVDGDDLTAHRRGHHYPGDSAKAPVKQSQMKDLVPGASGGAIGARRFMQVRLV